MIAERIELLSEYKPDFYIAIKKEQESQEIYDKLKEIFNRHHGDNVVYMYFLASKRLIKNQENFWIDGSDEVQQEIRELLGEDSLKTR